MTESVTTARDMMLRIGWEGDEEGFTVTVNVVVSVVVNIVVPGLDSGVTRRAESEVAPPEVRHSSEFSFTYSCFCSGLDLRCVRSTTRCSAC